MIHKVKGKRVITKADVNDNDITEEEDVEKQQTTTDGEVVDPYDYWLTTGASTEIYRVKYYCNSTTNTVLGRLSGVYYIWHGGVLNGRVRVTKYKDKVGVSGYCAGWIKVSTMDTGNTDAFNVYYEKGWMIEGDRTPCYPTGTANDDEISGLLVSYYFISSVVAINRRVPIVESKDDVGDDDEVVGWVDLEEVIMHGEVDWVSG